MASTNDHSIKRAILYYRVSGDEQKKRGYSLSDQRDTLRAWALENGYEVVEEIEDAGYSGAYLERPRLDRVRGLVSGGVADAVAARVKRLQNTTFTILRAMRAVFCGILPYPFSAFPP